MFTCGPALLGGSSIVGVTWNPSDKGSGATLSNGNLTMAGGSTLGWARATVGHSSGKYYFEVHIDTNGSSTQAPQVGVQLGGAANLNLKIGESAGLGWGIQQASAFTRDNGTLSGLGSWSYVLNDILQVAVDLTAGKIWWGINNTWINSGNPGAGTGATYSDLTGTLYPAISDTNASHVGVYTARFASASFTYTAPSGFGPW